LFRAAAQETDGDRSAGLAQLAQMNRHRRLIAWQRCHELAIEVCKASARLPSSERFELSSQLRRAAVSASANVAEGNARCGAAELAHGLSIALGSLAEVDALLAAAHDLGYLDEETHRRLDGLRDRASAAVFALQRRLRPSGQRATHTPK
jgi:four helix bundle protein